MVLDAADNQPPLTFLINFILSRRILQPFKAGDECDTFCERSEQYGRM